MLYLIKRFNTQNFDGKMEYHSRLTTDKKEACSKSAASQRWWWVQWGWRLNVLWPQSISVTHVTQIHFIDSIIIWKKKTKTKARNEWPQLLVKVSSIMSEQLKVIQLKRHNSNPALSFPAWAHSQRHCFSPQSSLSIILPVTQKGHFMITY